MISAPKHIRDDRYKLIRAPRPELYDFRADPAESRDISEDHASLVLVVHPAPVVRNYSIQPFFASFLSRWSDRASRRRRHRSHTIRQIMRLRSSSTRLLQTLHSTLGVDFIALGLPSYLLFRREKR